MASSSTTIAVVVPTLDEASAIAGCLESARAVADQLIVSDGGSRDDTVEIARCLGATVVCGSPGRGRQLNRGAESASADCLLFLHADSRLPDGARDALTEALAGGAIGGGFQVAFDAAGGLPRLGSRLVNLRSRLTRCPLGDQGQFCRRSAFEELGGFREWPILEDLDFIRRLKRRGRIALLSPPVATSYRRYQRRGIARNIATNWLIWALHFLGASPERLAALYRPPKP